MNVEELTQLLAKRKGTVASPDATVASIAGQDLKSVAPPNAEMIARLGAKKLAAGENVPVDALDANYVRRDENLFAPTK